MATTVSGFDYDAVRHILANLREWDRREIFATKHSDDCHLLTMEIDRVNGGKWIAWADDEPVAIIGACCPWPGYWSPWCFGTDKFAKVSLLLTRIGKRAIIPGARNMGGRLLECRSLEGHVDAQRWLEKCFGFKRFGPPLTKFGRDGETFHTYRLEL